MEKQALSISVRCAGNPACIFTGAGMPIEITIKNEVAHDIGVPISFLQKTGPSFILTDNLTGKKDVLTMNLADHDLMEEFTKLQAGESAIIISTINESELRTFRDHFIDLTAEVSISTKILVYGQSERVKFSGSSKLKIIGKDTLERDEPITPKREN